MSPFRNRSTDNVNFKCRGGPPSTPLIGVKCLLRWDWVLGNLGLCHLSYYINRSPGSRSGVITVTQHTWTILVVEETKRNRTFVPTITRGDGVSTTLQGSSVDSHFCL